jgi:hypothetical protein
MAYVVVAVLVLVSGAPVSAQQPGHPPGATDVAGADQQGRPSPHMMQMMQMCRQMTEHSGPMGGMGGGMMGMMPMTGGDPKQQADMMAMRGEMMKAMGDIMMKYAERMRPAK